MSFMLQNTINKLIKSFIQFVHIIESKWTKLARVFTRGLSLTSSDMKNEITRPIFTSLSNGP